MKMEFVALMATLLLLASHVQSKQSAGENFIRTSCNTTTYPALCVKTLIPYAASVGSDSVKLCTTALSAAIRSASNCSSVVAKRYSKRKGIELAEASVIRECIGDLKDAIYELRQTVGAMVHLRDGDREWQWANAKTYASAAITDAETCVDGILERKVSAAAKKEIQSCVAGTEKRIGVALSLINHLY